MAMLGDLLASARACSGQFAAWLEKTDPEFAKEVAEAAVREGLSPAGFARVAVADFSRLAAEEDWATLVSSVRDASNPGATCLFAMVHWRLTARACGHHSFHPDHQHSGAADERPRT